ncbi:MAG: hypothetical protein WCD37_10180 [Chloroflexia bacterium]
MSINGLTNDELRLQVQPRTASQNSSVTNVRGATAAEVQENPVTTALGVLIKYIPTEILALYVPTIAAIASIGTFLTFVDATFIYWFFGVLTFFTVLLVNIAKLAADPNYTGPLPWSIAKWPLWKMIAATIAFLAWALALPDNPYITTDGGRSFAGIVALFVSIFLSIFGTIFERRRRT